MTQTFDDIAASLSNPLQRYLERMTGSAALADELLQETLLRVARGLPRFEGRSSVKTWAFSIATRVAIDHLRRAEQRVHIVAFDEAVGVDLVDFDSEERLVVREMNACIRDIIDGLPAAYRAALVMHDFEGLTGAETARSLGCSLATAKIRIHRARARLRHALDEECAFYRDRGGVLRCDRKTPSDSS